MATIPHGPTDGLELTLASRNLDRHKQLTAISPDTYRAVMDVLADARRRIDRVLDDAMVRGREVIEGAQNEPVPGEGQAPDGNPAA